jgi:hypothetical protein
MSHLENWKDIEDYENYQVSNFGNIYSKTTEAFLSSDCKKHQYRYVTLSKNNKQSTFCVHRLVAKAFVYNSNPDLKTQVDHIDGNKRNNYASNLEWVSPSENVKRSRKTGLVSSTTNRNEIIEQLDSFGNVIDTFRDQNEASKKLNCTRGVIMSLIKPRRGRGKKGGKRSFPIQIIMKDKNTVIQTFQSIDEVATHFKLSKPTIQHFLNGTYKRIGYDISKRLTDNILETNFCCPKCSRYFGNIGGLKAHEKACGADRPKSIPDTYEFEIKQNIPILRLKNTKETDKEELWKDTINNNYMISSLGRMWNKTTKKFITGSNDGRYMRFANAQIGFREAIHRLVAMAFVENPDNKPYVNHIDANTYNNEAVNLEWVTQQENMLHSVSIGNNSTAKTLSQYDKNGSVINTFDSIKQASRITGMAETTISRSIKEQKLCSKRGESEQYVFKIV